VLKLLPTGVRDFFYDKQFGGPQRQIESIVTAQLVRPNWDDKFKKKRAC
jgi:hypothetical protein